MRILLVLLLIPNLAHADLRLVAAPAMNVECDDLELGPLTQALDAARAVLQKRSETLTFSGRSVSSSEYASRTLKTVADLARAGDRGKLCGALGAWFVWYQIANPILMTAYHTPSVRGSLSADETYRYPLYRRPKDGHAHDASAQILAGSLAGKNLELVWLADAYDALALQVEGAGNITLPDGSLLAIGADGHNGQTYQNVSKLLAADGEMPTGKAPAANLPGNPKARKYFSEHPAELNVYWAKNPHFVFFRRTAKAGSGKFGALTPGRSIAVDPARVPFGAVMWISAQKPTVDAGRITGYVPYTRLVLAQDTGAGIKGPGRIDVYYGEDDYAQLASAATSVQGVAYVLLLK